VNVTQSDDDEKSVSLKAQYYDSGDDQAWTPLFSFKEMLVFDPTFA
jgi:hypothetical protein